MGRFVRRQIHHPDHNITPVDGAAPKRFIVIEFDSLEHAKAWRASETTKEIDAIRAKTAKSSEFIVGGM